MYYLYRSLYVIKRLLSLLDDGADERRRGILGLVERTETNDVKGQQNDCS